MSLGCVRASVQSATKVLLEPVTSEKVLCSRSQIMFRRWKSAHASQKIFRIESGKCWENQRKNG